MPIMIKENVERIVSDADVDKRKKEGYKVLTKAAAQAAAAQAAAEKKAAEEAEKAAKEAEEKAKAEEAAKVAEEVAAQAAAPAAGGEGAGTNAGAVNYEEMKLNDLRKIAKEKGIQGYNNMDKATLIAVIQAH